MYSEDDLLPISALQHLDFCPRQCGLIHIERLWEENVFTTQGKHLHEKAHGGTAELRGEVLTVRSLRLRSLELGLTGQADIVEYHQDPDRGVALPHRTGLWLPFPVEYKRGTPKKGNCDKVQLCAQALCLEEMLGTSIVNGAMFYGKTRRRLDVTFSSDLRAETQRLALELHELIASRKTPDAKYVSMKCDSCSLLSLCRPKASEGLQSVAKWFDQQLSGD